MCQIYKKQGHTTSSCFVLRDTLQGKSSTSLAIISIASSETSGVSSSTWLLDSKTSHHLTPNKKQVPNASSYGGIECIVVGNGNSIPISSVGLGFLHVNDSFSITVNHLLRALCDTTNLISV